MLVSGHATNAETEKTGTKLLNGYWDTKGLSALTARTLRAANLQSKPVSVMRKPGPPVGSS
jgi:hypothetical protein